MKENQLPHRVQLKRTKGYRIEPNTQICDRRGIYGNPYRVVKVSYSFYPVRKSYFVVRNGMVWTSPSNREDATSEAIALFDTYIGEINKSERREWLKPLLGKNLACWCPKTSACHTDVLFKWLKIEFGQEYEVNE